jgi:Recombination endonuclease VII
MVDEMIAPALFACLECEIEKPESEFFRDNRKKYGARIQAKCKVCVQRRAVTSRLSNLERFRKWERDSKSRRSPEKKEAARLRTRHYTLKYNFGMTIDDLSTMLSAQNGECAVCEDSIVVSVSGKGSRTVACVDHDHETGKVRGLLCHSCNTALGLFKDDKILLLKAFEYLKDHDACEFTSRRSKPSNGPDRLEP